MLLHAGPMPCREIARARGRVRAQRGGGVLWAKGLLDGPLAHGLPDLVPMQ